MEQGVQLFSLPLSAQDSLHCLTHNRLLTNICWKQWIQVFPKEKKNLFGIPEAKEQSVFVLLLFRNIPFQLATYTVSKASHVVLVVKNPPPNARDVRDAVSIPGSGSSPGGGHGNLPQYSCLENPMDRGAWRATVYEVMKSQTWLKWLSTHTTHVSNMRNVYLKVLSWVETILRRSSDKIL